MPNRNYMNLPVVEVRGGRPDRFSFRKLRWAGFSQFTHDPHTPEKFNAAAAGTDEAQKQRALWRLAEIAAFRAYNDFQPQHYDPSDMVSDLFENCKGIWARLPTKGDPSAAAYEFLSTGARWLVGKNARRIRIQSDYSQLLARAMQIHESPITALAGLPDRYRGGITSKKHKKPWPSDVYGQLLRFFVPKINATVDRLNAIDNGGKLTPRIVRLYAYLDALQSLRVCALGMYIPTKTPRVVFTQQQRISRTSPDPKSHRTGDRPMNVNTPVLDFRKFFTTPPAPAAYSTITIATGIPTGDGIIPLGTEVDSEVNSHSFGKVILYANATATSQFKCKLVGWQQFDTDGIPITLADLTCTVGTATRTNGEKIVSAITVNSGLVVANYEVVPADNNIQLFKLDFMGLGAIQLVPGPVVSGTVNTIGAALSQF